MALDSAAVIPLLAFLRVLSDAPPPDRIGVALVEGMLRELQPGPVSVYLLDRSGAYLEERVRYGAAPEPTHLRAPLDAALPLTEVFRTGRAMSWTIAEAARAYPAVAGWAKAQPSPEDRVLIVPIRAGGRPVGGLIVALPAPVELGLRARVLVDAACVALGVWALSEIGRPAAPGRPRPGRGTAPTERQTRIIEAVAAGASNADIARKLSVSVGTVKADLAQLYRQYGVSDRNALAELVRAAGTSR
jgi:DNA-binding CsgD family transcriptional regulator